MFERLRSFVRRPLLGSFVFGLFVEGVPVGTFLYLLDLDKVGISLPWLMPLSVLVVFLGDSRWGRWTGRPISEIFSHEPRWIISGASCRLGDVSLGL